MRLFTASWCFALSLSYAAALSTAGANSPDEKKSSKPLYTFNQLWELEKGFWDAFLYPANLKQVQGNQSTIFAADVRIQTQVLSSDSDKLTIQGARSSRHNSYF